MLEGLPAVQWQPHELGDVIPAVTVHLDDLVDLEPRQRHPESLDVGLRRGGLHRFLEPLPHGRVVAARRAPLLHD